MVVWFLLYVESLTSDWCSYVFVFDLWILVSGDLKDG